MAIQTAYKVKDGNIATAQLSTGGQLFIYGIREWRLAKKKNERAQNRLDLAYSRCNANSALIVFDELMHQFVITVNRPIQVHCICKKELSEDEHKILEVMQFLQRADDEGARKILSDLMKVTYVMTFMRVAKAYLTELKLANISLLGVSHLKLVSSK